MNVANIEYRVRGLIKTLLQLNRRRKQTVVASKLISAQNFEGEQAASRISATSTWLSREGRLGFCSI